MSSSLYKNNKYNLYWNVLKVLFVRKADCWVSFSGQQILTAWVVTLSEPHIVLCWVSFPGRQVQMTCKWDSTVNYLSPKSLTPPFKTSKSAAYLLHPDCFGVAWSDVNVNIKYYLPFVVSFWFKYCLTPISAWHFVTSCSRKCLPLQNWEKSAEKNKYT